MDLITGHFITIASNFIKDLGFPIFVAVWVLLITHRDTKKLTHAINALTRASERANIHIENKEKGGET